MPQRVDPRVRDMTEDELSREVIKRAQHYGWKVYSVARSDRARLRCESSKGFPDLLLMRPGMIAFAELKRYGGKLTPEQDEWLHLLASTFTSVHAWTPEHWFSGQIEEVLSCFFHANKLPDPPEPLVA